MVLIILRIFAFINVLIGMAMVAKAVWPAPDPVMEKSPVMVAISVLWAVLYLGVAYGLFYWRQWARILAIGLYGVSAFMTVCGFAFMALSQDKVFREVPWAAFLVYFLFLVTFVAPIIFMLHPKVKDAFIQKEETRLKAEEHAGRATFKRRR